MRTSIDMPAPLMRAAKARAAERGESLKDLVNRAVSHELGLPSAPKAKAGRVTLPLIGHGAAHTTLATLDTKLRSRYPSVRVESLLTRPMSR